MRGCFIRASCKSAFRIALLLVLTALASGVLPQESGQQLLIKAKALFREARWRDARDTYERVLSQERAWHTSDALQAMQGTILCAAKLNDWDEVWRRVHHYRRHKSEEESNSPNWSFRNREEEERQNASRRLELIRQTLQKLADHLSANQAQATPERRQQLSEEQIATDFDTVEVMLGVMSAHRGGNDSELWWGTAAQEDSEADQERSWWDFRERGIPVGPDGKPQFVAVPATYTSDLGIGAKVLYLLDEIERLDTTKNKNSAARALLRRALIAVGLYGPISDRRWESSHRSYDWSGRPFFGKPKPNESHKPFWELADDEVRTRVDGRAQVIKLPGSENPQALLRLVEGKYPGSDAVPESIFARGEYYQSRQQFDQALAAYGELLKVHPKHARSKDAAKQIENIFKPGVLLGSTTFFVPGEKPLLTFACRRTDRIEFKVRAVDLEGYYQDAVKKGLAAKDNPFTSYGFIPDFSEDLEKKNKEVGRYLSDSSKYWCEKVPETERVTTRTTQLRFDQAGAYLVQATTEEGKPSSRVMVVITDIIIVHRQLRDRSLVYVADSRTGQPVADQEVYFYSSGSDKRPVGKLKTNKDGAIETAFKGESDIHLGALSRAGGPAFASIRPRYERGASQEKEQLSYAITDRPVYRPGSRVHFRLYQRQSLERRYLPPRANQRVQVSITAPQNHIVKSLDLRTDSFGGVTGEFELSQEAALGEYSIRTEDQYYRECYGSFRVESYKKPKFEVTIHPAEPVRPGAKARVRIQAHYLFGGPVAGGRVRFQIHRTDITTSSPVLHEFDWLYGPGYIQNSPRYPWLTGNEEKAFFVTDQDRYEDPELDDYEHHGLLVRRGEAHLDDKGMLTLEIDTVPNIGQRFSIEAEVRDASRRTIRAQGEVLVIAQEHRAKLELDRGWYQPNAEATVAIQLRSVTGADAAGKGKLRLERIRYSGPAHDRTHFETVMTKDVEADDKGQCRAPLPRLPEGQYRVSFLTSDSRKPETSAQEVFWVHGPKFLGMEHRLSDLEIIPDQPTYKVGDVAHVLIHVAQPKTRILFSDDLRSSWLHTYRFLDITDHAAVIDIPIEERHVPNFFVGATAVGNGGVHSEACELFVPPVRDLLTVRLDSSKQIYRPGEEGRIRITVSDGAGKPVAGQLTLAAYDKAVTYIQDEILPQPTTLLQQARLRRSYGFSDMQEDKKFRPTGSLICPEFEIGGGRSLHGLGLAGLGGLVGAGGGTPDIQEQVAELVTPKYRDSGSRRDAARSRGQDVAPAVRRDFADTAVWRAAADVGADGVATVKFAFPDSLTTWRLRAFAMSKSTQTGEAAAEITTRKNLLVRLQTPRFLVEGDEVVLSANIHNTLRAEKRVTAELIAPGALLRSTAAATNAAKPDTAGNIHLLSQIVVTAGGTQRIDWPCQVLHAGLASLTVKALTDEESDALQLPVPILTRGSLKEEARTGSFQKHNEETQSFTITLPAKADPSASELDISVSPGPAGVMLDALPFLIQYPYGCTEQTMSRFYPIIIAADALKKSGTDLEMLGKRRPIVQTPKLADRFHDESLPIFNSAEMKRLAQVGLDRLYAFQHEDYGWGWWKSDASSPYMTAYVLTGLVAAQKAGLDVHEKVIERGYWYLNSLVRHEPLRRPEGLSAEDWETECFLTYVLSLDTPNKPKRSDLSSLDPSFDQIAGKHRAELVKHLDRLGPYGRALLALALHNAREIEPAKRVLDSLLSGVTRNDQNGTAFVRTSTNDYWRWWHSDVETSAWTLRAVLRIDPDNELTLRLVKWLVEKRSGGRFWRSTRDTALAVAALADFVIKRKEELADCQVEIRLDGEITKIMTPTRDKFLAGDHRLVLDGKLLRPGSHRLSLKKTGRGDVHFSSRLRYLSQEEVFSPSAHGIALKREYYRLGQDGKGTRVRLNEGDSVPVGEVLETVLTVIADHTYEYLAFEDVKPAGCEPIQVQSGQAWFGNEWATVELRDDKVLFFVRDLSAGEHTFRYRLRAEVPGQFLALPASGFAMYNPEIRANSEGKRIRIVDLK